MEILEDFGQTVDLTRRIREVLANYPEGTTVLKELIQNADDAGAKKVALCLDRRAHGVNSLLAPGLAACQGPALLAYNDAVFTEADFASISRIGGSGKQAQPWKTGRFGVGFNSVYHLTDLPSFVSGKHVVLFDPQRAYLPNVSVSNPGKRIEYVSTSALKLYEDQFSPYCAFGCNMRDPFSGTLFRFPLRTAQQAASSRLSKQAYVEDDIISLMSQLYEEAMFSLLFLKNIISLEMYLWDAGWQEPQKLYSCSIGPVNDSTSLHRQALVRFSSTSVDSSKQQLDLFSLDFHCEAFFGEKIEKKSFKYFIVQGMASMLSKIGAFATAAAKEYDLHLLPWASVAACITDGIPEESVLKQGHAFCFLPLPVKTGLSVQINGYFELSSNRRDIWYGSDMDRGGKLRSDWNRLLLEDIVAPVFKELFLALRSVLESKEVYYSLWPSGSFEEPWNLLVGQIYKSIYNSPLLYSEIGAGLWVSAAEAVIHDEEFSRSSDLGEALLLLEMPIVHLPRTIVDMMSQFYAHFSLRFVSPDTVRAFLLECQTLADLNKSHKLVLLEYCLSNLDDGNVGKCMNGLPLLPLANNRFGMFLQKSKNMPYYICSDIEFELLHAAHGFIIDKSIPSELFNKLSHFANGKSINITFLDGPSFLQFFPRLFPPAWKHQGQVEWNPLVTDSYPTAAWFKLFWKYIEVQSYDLALYCDWPILPSTSGHLLRPSPDSKLINADILSSKMKQLLVKLGCKILDTQFRIHHSQLSLYVNNSDAAGVLQSIRSVVSPDCDNLQIYFQYLSPDEKTELSQFLLDPRWYLGDSNLDLDISFCRDLPIFKVYPSVSSGMEEFSDLSSFIKYLPPLGVPLYLLNSEFLCLPPDNGSILLRYYGIERMNRSTFFHIYVLNNLHELQPGIRDSVMLTILRDLPQLSLENSNFKETLKELKFVPATNGTLCSPVSLYDPRVDELYMLLEESDCFPSGLFQDPEVLDMLVSLGLRTVVSMDTIIQSARSIESLMHKDQLSAFSRGKLLLSYLEVNAHKWFSDKLLDGKKVNGRLTQMTKMRKSRDASWEGELERFWGDLRIICWCPVLVVAPNPALPWPSVSSLVAPPKQVRLQEDMWIVSASSRILDGECTSSILSYCLGWSLPPSGSVIAAQLLELGKNNECVSDQQLRQELAVVMPKFYSLLSTFIASDEMDIVKVVLEGCRWIWVGDGFGKADEVVLSCEFQLAPFIRVIPIDLAVFKELFLELGIKEFLRPEDYANVLRRMAEKKASFPLDSQELRTAILVVQHLAEFRFQDLGSHVYLPDSSSRLSLSSDLLYNDAPWLIESGVNIHENASKLSLSSKNSVHKFVHGNISNDVAERLGVRSLRRSLLAESSDSMNLSLSGVAEAFGQHEALTTRLKHIVEMYADGPGILFELVQNAEDALASEVVFMLDKTQYGTSSILSPELAEWQGPALYSFNNSVFTPQDLYAISRIGQDSKLEKPFAIGRFGLGFNCVYHFTDIPSFISGENIVMFDPHARYLPGISPSHPGLRIQFAGRRILEQFPDQFTPFLHFGCDLQQAFPGTLFRFPLRSEASALKSQIKKEKYTPEDVEMLFSSFSDVVAESMLFLRNVKKITLYVKEGAAQEMKLIHCVSKHACSEVKKEPHPLSSMLNFVHGNRQAGFDRDQFFKKLVKTQEFELPWKCRKVAIVEQKSVDCLVHWWVTSECIGGGNAKQLSAASANKSHCFVPWASVAAYLYSVPLNVFKEMSSEMKDAIDGNDIMLKCQSLTELSQERRKFEGRAFCFLPLPVATSLPAHVNAYFELSSNRRDIWLGNDMSGGGRVRSEWNVALLEDAVAPAYGYLLEAISEDMGPSDSFLSFWPTAIAVEPWALMVRKLYVSISERGLKVLYTKARGGQWVSTKQAIFPDFSFSKATELVDILTEAGLPVASVSKQIVEKFMESCKSLNLLNPQLLRNLLIRRKRGFNNKEAAIVALEYCLTDVGISSFAEKLPGLPLIPLANGSFATFSIRGEGERLYFASQEEYDLLKGSVPNVLIDSSVPDYILKKLGDVANSNLLNIRLLSCKSLLDMFPKVLPPEWFNARKITWTPGEHGHPSLEWMTSFWSYLNNSCADLSIFSKWPVLPVGDSNLIQLSSYTSVMRDGDWSENMHSLLQKLGCYFLRTDIPLDHPQLKFFVQDSTATGVLNAIQSVTTCEEDLKAIFTEASTAEMHELRSFILQNKWFSGKHMNSSNISLIKLLPIFESYKNRELVSLTNPRKWLKPEGMHENLLTENFIRTESDKEKTILMSVLDIREPRKAEFYEDHVLGRISEFISQPAVLSSILSDVRALAAEDSSIKTVLSEVPFVLAEDGAWVRPSRLYDPRIVMFKKLLHKDKYFPSKEFMAEEVLESLVFFGLRQTVGFTMLLDSANSVSMMHDLQQSDAVAYGQRLLTYLDHLGSMLSKSSKLGNSIEDEFSNEGNVENLSETIKKESHQADDDFISSLRNFVYDLPEDEFWSKLNTICWCPVIISSVIKGLPWFHSEDPLAPPSQTRPKSQMWRVSCRMRILDGDCSSMYAQEKLGWLSPLKGQMLSEQLIELSNSYNRLKLQSEESPVDAVLQKEMPLLYSALQEFVGTDDIKVVKELLSGIPWVYIGDSFVAPSCLAFDSPVKYPPYLYVVPSELTQFRLLLLELGVRQTFDSADYLRVLQHLHSDTKGQPLSSDQLTFVHCLLEAFSDTYGYEGAPEVLSNLLLVPDSSGVLLPAGNVVYNDAPWMNSTPSSKHFVHSSISDDLARRLGVQSLRGSALVDDELMRELSCLDYARICELLALYGESGLLIFDLLELADYCRAKKVNLFFDKREHPRRSLLHQNLGEFQGPSLTVVFEGAVLTRDEVCGLQSAPPWKLRGNIVNYGLGFLSCFSVCDVLTILSGGYFYMFDPLGLTLGTESTSGPTAKLFSLSGTSLVDRFQDQFAPLRITQDPSLSTSSSTIIRMPLSSKCINELETNHDRVQQIFDRFTQHSASAILFLGSVSQVSLSTWENGKSQPSLNYSVLVDPAADTMRNPFSEKKWRKFQISRLFGSTAAITKMHVIDVHVIESGSSYVDRWFVVLCLGSGQTRNMALDRRYIAYNLTPVAGVAAHIARNGMAMNIPESSCILAPLPLSGLSSMPVTILGHFLVQQNSGRYLFCNIGGNSSADQYDTRHQLINLWNKELLLCVRDSYIEMVLEFHKLRKDPLSSAIESKSAQNLSFILQNYGDSMYSLWPRSKYQLKKASEDDSTISRMLASKESVTDWGILIEQVVRPFYLRLVDLPVWQLYRGNLVKVDEGMFLSHTGAGDDSELPSPGVCSFIKEHYPVFSVPSELVKEIQSVGVTVKEIKPKMVRELLKTSSSVILRSIDIFIDVLEYCLSDIHRNWSQGMDGFISDSLHLQQTGLASLASSSNSSGLQHSHVLPASTSEGDAVEIMTSFGRALYDFGRGVVEDISRTSDPLPDRNPSSSKLMSTLVSNLKGIPLVTATESLTRLGSSELWVGTRDQQLIMHQLADNFIHPQCMERPIIAELLSIHDIYVPLKLKPFTPQLLSSHLKFLFTEHWIKLAADTHGPCIPWADSVESSIGPNSQWIRNFWRTFEALNGDLSLVSEWPLVPAYLNGPVLCRVKDCNIIFVPPVATLVSETQNDVADAQSSSAEISDNAEEKKTLEAAYEFINMRFPWLFPLLNRLDIPIFDITFPECCTPCNLAPSQGETVGHKVLSKLLALKVSTHIPGPICLENDDCDRLFALFASEVGLREHQYQRNELNVLRELPIYKTVVGTYTNLVSSDHYIVNPSAFFHPNDERRLLNQPDTDPFFRALGVQQLGDQDVLVRFALPGFENKTTQEQEDTLFYLYANWNDLQSNDTILNTLKETKFVKSSVEQSTELYRPKDLLDPSDSLLSSVFSGERNMFPGERYTSDVWLRILRKAGLRTSLEADMIVECARKVESMGKHSLSCNDDTDDFDAEFLSRNEISLEIWMLAESVINTLLANFATLYDNSFCERVGKIEFVPAEKGLPSICGKKGGKRVLTSYSEAILLKDWPLAWSSAPIIMKQSLLPPEFSWGAFRLRTPPPFPTVLKHLQAVGKGNGEDTLAHWPSSSGMMRVEDAFLQMLNYLHKIWGSLSSSDKAELHKLSFIPVANGTRLVSARSLFARLTINMSPFAFELPSMYLPFMSILREIGMEENLTISSAKDYLLNIQKACGYQRLNPNELRAVMEMLEYMCSGVTAATSIGSEGNFDLVIPDDGCRLVSSASCVFVDFQGSRYLDNIDTSRLRFAHPKLSDNICKALGVKPLSDVIVEELDKNEELQFVDSIGSLHLNRVREKLRSATLKKSIFVLLNSIKNHLLLFEGQSLNKISALLDGMAENLKFVRCLYTRFLLQPRLQDITRVVLHSSVPEWLGGGKHRSIYFADKSSGNILVAEPPTFLTVHDALAVAVSHLLQAPVILPIGSLFDCPDGSELEVLRILKLGSEAGQLKSDGRISASLGAELLSQDAQQVQILPLRPFYNGEIVAWQTGIEGERLRYGRVPEDVRPSAGQALYRVLVETAPGEMQMLLSTQVFSFRSVAMADATSSSSSSSSGDGSERMPENGSTQAISSSDSSSHQENAKVQYGKVSTVELVRAVHDMLSVAGVNIDVEKQTLIQTTLDLQDQLKESQVALLVEQEKADAAAKEADIAKSAWTCRICLSSEVDVAMVPCGHVLCQRCASSVSRCPFCRTQVTKKMKIFKP